MNIQEACASEPEVSTPDKEEWRSVVTTNTSQPWGDRYEVSSSGCVREQGRGVLPRLDRLYAAVSMCTTAGRHINKRVNLLVLIAFCGVRPEGSEAANFDGDSHNVAMENLCWKVPDEDLEDEEWCGVVGWEDFYEVSNKARVRSLERRVRSKTGATRRVRARHLVKTLPKGSPYLLVHLQDYRDGRKETYTVASLVCEAFHGKRPPGLEACHQDGNHKNDFAYNLRWDTSKGNMVDRDLHGTTMHGEKSHKTRLTQADVKEIFFSLDVANVVARRYEIGVSGVNRIRAKKTWKRLSKDWVAPQRKMSDEQVRELFVFVGTKAEAAKHFGVSEAYARSIRSGKDRRHVTKDLAPVPFSPPMYLSDEQVREMRASNLSPEELSESRGVSLTSVNNLLSGKTWQSVK